MKYFFDKLGYILIILGFVVALSEYGKYFVFESVYLILGEKTNAVVKSKYQIDEKSVYYVAILKDGSNYGELFKTQKTKKELFLNEIIEIRTVPIFKIVLFGEFYYFPYIFGLTFVLVGFFISIFSFSIIFNITNPITRLFQRNP